MHQILSLRPWLNPKTGKWDQTDSRHWELKLGFESIEEMLKAPQSFYAPIPENDRYNLFYTVAHCTDKKREFHHQDILMFDLDQIRMTPAESSWGGFLEARTYCDVVSEVLQVPLEALGILCSGNGLHFIIKLSAPFYESKFFEDNRRHYRAVCGLVDARLSTLGLPCKTDPAVFDPRRIMRYPGTENRKEGKAPKFSYVIQSSLIPQGFSLPRISRLPEVPASDQMPREQAKAFPKIDTEGMVSGCEFLKFCKSSPAQVREDQWYAMLSLLGRADRKLAHEYSQGHPGYTHAETELKIDQALEASGPRTCQGIQKLWGKCGSCPNFEKITSPITIKTEAFIATEFTGFHRIMYMDGGAKKFIPAPEDLAKFFEREHPYTNHETGGQTFIFKKTHWRPFSGTQIENFAQTHYNPTATTAKTVEFKNLIQRTNLVHPDWFSETTRRKINFKNGVLDLETLELLPHGSGFGFKYVLHYDYDPQARAPRFEQFLQEVMAGRQDLVDLLLEYTGYCFSGDECWAQKMMLLTGEGANGKSTFMDVLKALAGKDNYSSVMMHKISDPVECHSLVGKLFNLAEETPGHSLYESAAIKNAVSGGEMRVKQLYAQPFSVKNTTKFMYACNELPRTKDTTLGMNRRFLIVPFNVKFEGKNDNKGLKKELLKELPGIFNLIIRAYQRLISNQAFTESEAVRKEVEEFKRDNDTVLRWVQSCLFIEPLSESVSHLVTVDTLYQSYRIFCDRQGEKAESQPIFCRRIGRHIPHWSERRHQGSTRRDRKVSYRGIQIIDEDSSV